MKKIALFLRIWNSITFRLNRLGKAILVLLLGKNKAEEVHFNWIKMTSADAGYGADYYAYSERANSTSYIYIAEAVTGHLPLGSFVDVGCGNGGISRAFMNLGWKLVSGFDYSMAAIRIARAKDVEPIEQIDLTKIRRIPCKSDLCLCIEVAEHIPESSAERLCCLLATVAPLLIFTAAPPGQGGRWHINEQPQQYWVSLMAQQGMVFDGPLTIAIKKTMHTDIVPHYRDNLMVFRRKSTDGKFARPV